MRLLFWRKLYLSPRCVFPVRQVNVIGNVPPSVRRTRSSDTCCCSSVTNGNRSRRTPRVCGSDRVLTGFWRVETGTRAPCGRRTVRSRPCWFWSAEFRPWLVSGLDMGFGFTGKTRGSITTCDHDQSREDASARSQTVRDASKERGNQEVIRLHETNSLKMSPEFKIWVFIYFSDDDGF